MALTRRSARFKALATALDAACSQLGTEVPAAVVDAALNERIEYAAERLRVTPRTALVGYATDEVVPDLAGLIVRSVREAVEPAAARVIDLDAQRKLRGH